MPAAPSLAVGAEPPVSGDATPPAPDSVNAEPAMIEVWRPGRPREQRKPEHKRPQRKEREASKAASAEGEKPRHEQREKRGKDRNQNRGKRDNGNFKPRPERREKPLDPNSPFASLMALKERLEADKKDKG